MRQVEGGLFERLGREYDAREHHSPPPCPNLNAPESTGTTSSVNDADSDESSDADSDPDSFILDLFHAEGSGQPPGIHMCP